MVLSVVVVVALKMISSQKDQTLVSHRIKFEEPRSALTCLLKIIVLEILVLVLSRRIKAGQS